MTEAMHLVCSYCNTVNRMSRESVNNNPVCGKCHHNLFTGEPVELASKTIKKYITRNDIPVIVDFWAPWCGPCKTMAPAFSQAASEFERTVRFAKLNTENEPAVATQFGIRSVPTLILFRRGEIIANQAGALARLDIVQWVKSYIQ